MADTENIATIKLQVDNTELEATLDAALAKAERIHALLVGRSPDGNMHPDDVVDLICDVAKNHGYGVIGIELQALRLVGEEMPRHSYGTSRIDPGIYRRRFRC